MHNLKFVSRHWLPVVCLLPFEILGLTNTVFAVPPVLTCPNVSVECTGGLTPVTYHPTAADSSGGALPVTCVPPSGSNFRLGSSNVTCTATDNAGATGTCTFKVTVVDTTPPVITCNTNISIFTMNAGGETTGYTASAFDPCGIGFLDCNPPPGSTFPIGSTTVICQAVDTSNNTNSCSFKVTVTLAAPPVVTCPNISTECTGGLTAVNYAPSAVDFLGAPLVVTCIPASGTGFRLGTSNVTCTATDNLGASGSCTFTVTVVDTTPPRITCNTNISIVTSSPGGEVVTYTAAAFDSCGIAFLDCAPPPGSTFPIGTTTVHCQAADTSGNSNTCSFQINVVLAKGPVVVSCTNVLKECTGGLTPVTFIVTAADSGGATLPVTCVPPSGTGFRLGSSNVTCTASDNLGNTGSCTFVVTVVDTTPPNVTCSTNISVTTGSAGGEVVSYVASATDACGISFLDCAPPPGSTFPIGSTSVTCKAGDNAGNTNACSFPVTVTLGTPPVLTCPNISAECTGGLTPVNFTATAVDSSGNPLPLLCTPPSGTAFRLGTSNVICMAADTVGVSSCAFIVAVVDTTPPRVVCNSNILLAASSPAGAVANYVASAFDACGIASLDCAPPPGSTFPIGATTVVCKAVDTSGNSNSCSFVVTVQGPNQPPVCLVNLGCSLTFPGDPNTYGITLNGSNACLVLDGSGSSDPDHNALTFTWTIDGQSFHSPILTNCLDLGCHSVLLSVSDGQAVSGCLNKMCVLSACDVIQKCVLLVDSSAIAQKSKRPLMASLAAACDSCNRGDFVPGMNQLQAFQNKVRAQLGVSNPIEAAAFINCAQNILNTINCAVMIAGENRP